MFDYSIPLCFDWIYLFCSHLQVGYHLRFSFTPRKAPPKEKSELDPNSDLDWHTLSLFPLLQLPGPREQYDKEGGTPGKTIYLLLFLYVFICIFPYGDLFCHARPTILLNLFERESPIQKYPIENLEYLLFLWEIVSKSMNHPLKSHKSCLQK